ncbi:hypothetical protein B0H66DRAFT_631653 [Apodospora peruviana]|uniref:Uncharacterized protein n=1 Tax=Apodospora peruviana TaxID=516989 RepID=A0AAE0HTY1_9PEZI|nr:hypothetical protein B0H66DRAFT_631653 [Apodospora peruviana]
MARRPLRAYLILALFLGVCVAFFVRQHKPIFPPPTQDQPSAAVTNDNKLIRAMQQNFSIVLVVAKMTHESVTWIARDLPGLHTAIYEADGNDLPMNKGNEAMTYLTYIIDHYAHLPDIAIFSHAHKAAWHNPMFLDQGSAAALIRRLNGVRVEREGYVNLRCDWEPGCPVWIDDDPHQAGPAEDETTNFRKAWAEIHPNSKMPTAMGQACCAQFAVSGYRIRATPLERWEQYRSWLINTELSSYMSGRVFEHMWQYLFTGEGVWCPDVSSCYCDGFGVCFGSADKMRDWVAEGERLKTMMDEYLIAMASSPGDETDKMRVAIDGLERSLKARLDEAIREGDRYMTWRL